MKRDRGLVHRSQFAREGGFTIVELTAVIALIGVLAAILLPALARARESARRTNCSAKLQNLWIAMSMYAEENGGAFPWSGGGDNADCLITLLKSGGIEPESFVCPSDAGFTVDDFYISDRKTGADQFNFAGLTGELYPAGADQVSLRGSYDYIGAYTVEPLKLPPPTRPIPKVPLMWDRGAELKTGYNHVPGGSNVVWLDGSVSFLRSYETHSPYLPFRPDGLEMIEPVGLPPGTPVAEEEASVIIGGPSP